MTNIQVKGIFTEQIKSQVKFVSPHYDKLEIDYDFIKWEATSSGEGDFRSPVWQEMVFNKIKYNIDVLKTMPENSLVIFTDMDVIPFQKYNILKSYVDNYDICFMDEGLSDLAVNTGFILVKNTKKSRQIFDDWYEVCKNARKEHKIFQNQPIFNEKVYINYSCNINLFPREIIAREPEFVTENTIAYHAIACTGNNVKIKRMTLALNNYLKIKNERKL